MLGGKVCSDAPGKRARYELVRRFGYGVPSFERANASAQNHLALFAQARAVADRALRRSIAQREPIACGSGNRPFQHQLNITLASGRNRPLPQKYHPRANLRGRMMQPHGRPLRDRLTFGRKQTEMRIN
jgi:hypothetical protein